MKYKLIPILIFLSGIGYFATEIYLPSLPSMSCHFTCNNTLVQLTITTYLLAFSISQLIFGPLSDHFGRRKILLICLVLGFLGTIICWQSFSRTVHWLIIGRFVQGMGLAGVAVTSRAVFPDLLEGVKLAKFSSCISIFVPMFIALGPILGGYIEVNYGWIWGFKLLMLIIAILFLVVFSKLPETNSNLIENHKIKYTVIMNNYLLLFKNKNFWGYAICSSAASSGMIAYLSSSPFLFQNIIGLTPVEFGWLATISCVAVTTAALINMRYVEKFGINFMLTIAGMCMFVAGISMLYFAFFAKISVLNCITPIFFFVLGLGLTSGNSMSGVVGHFPYMAGTTVALLGSMQTLCGAFSSFIMALMPTQNQIPLATVFTVLGLLHIVSLYILVKYVNNKGNLKMQYFV